MESLSRCKTPTSQQKRAQQASQPTEESAASQPASQPAEESAAAAAAAAAIKPASRREHNQPASQQKRAQPAAEEGADKDTAVGRSNHSKNRITALSRACAQGPTN